MEHTLGVAQAGGSDALGVARIIKYRQFSPEGAFMGSARKISGAVICLAAGSALVLVASAGKAQENMRLDFSALFDKTEVMIPMRDGVKLHTEIDVPKNISDPLPILFERTPYGIAAPDKGASNMIRRYSDMVPDGYIFVFQDIRGRYESEGKFVMLHPLHDANDRKGIDESTDAYDTIDWLIKNVPHNNGRVGMNGISYDGYLVTEGMINPHPALKAASE